MSWPLQEKFTPGAPISQVPREWFETVSKILNYLEGAGVTIEKSADPSESNPWRIRLDVTDTAPALHATTHMGAHAGGDDTDPIRLDELKAPTDVTSLNVSGATHGLCPKLPATEPTTKFLRGDGSWALAGGLGTGTADGQLLIWSDLDQEWQTLSPGDEGKALSVVSGVPGWASVLRGIESLGWAGAGYLYKDANTPPNVTSLLSVPAGDVAHTSAVTSNSMLWIAAGTTNAQVDMLDWVIANKIQAEGGAVADGMVLRAKTALGTTQAYWEEMPSLLEGTAHGQMLVWDNEDMEWQTLAPGALDQVLAINAAGVPEWEDFDGLPSAAGKTHRMVLQLDASLAPIWDWTRAH